MCEYMYIFIDEFVKEVNVKIYLSSCVTSCSFVDFYRRFGVTCSIYSSDLWHRIRTVPIYD